MKHLIVSLVFACAFVIPASSHAAPKNSKNNKTTKNQPKQNPAPKQQPKQQPPKDNNIFVEGAGTQTGVIKSIRVDTSGAITDITILLAGSVHKARVRGCGAKSADQPLMNWAFQNDRLVYIDTDGSGCFSAVTTVVP